MYEFYRLPTQATSGTGKVGRPVIVTSGDGKGRPPCDSNKWDGKGRPPCDKIRAVAGVTRPTTSTKQSVDAILASFHATRARFTLVDVAVVHDASARHDTAHRLGVLGNPRVGSVVCVRSARPSQFAASGESRAVTRPSLLPARACPYGATPHTRSRHTTPHLFTHDTPSLHDHKGGKEHNCVKNPPCHSSRRNLALLVPREAGARAGVLALGLGLERLPESRASRGRRACAYGRPPRRTSLFFAVHVLHGRPDGGGEGAILLPQLVARAIGAVVGRLRQWAGCATPRRAPAPWARAPPWRT